jgi:hypothetical protein
MKEKKKFKCVAISVVSDLFTLGSIRLENGLDQPMGLIGFGWVCWVRHFQDLIRLGWVG